MKEWREIVKEMELPLQQKYEQVSQSLGATVIGLMSVFADKLSWDIVNSVIISLVSQAGKETAKKVIEEGKIKQKNAQSAFAAYVYHAVNMTPNWNIKVLKYTPNRVVIEGRGECVLCTAVKNAGLEDKVKVYEICKASHSNIIKGIDLRLDYRVVKGMCIKNNNCKFIIGY